MRVYPWQNPKRETQRFDNSKAYVWKEKFDVLKVKKPVKDAFANIIDENETTAIARQGSYPETDVLLAEKDWRIITFNMVLPFGMVGFLARISKALAEEKISIFAISAYSTDHVLVKDADLQKAKVTLENLGFSVGSK
ncbi:MAG: ACT domain-containing protein [Candidatus Micrarchaeia archaeon]